MGTLILTVLNLGIQHRGGILKEIRNREEEREQLTEAQQTLDPTMQARRTQGHLQAGQQERSL